MPKPKSNPAPPTAAAPSEFELLVEETNSLAIRAERKAELTVALRGISNRMKQYKTFIETAKVTNQQEADAVGEKIAEMKKDEELAIATVAREVDGFYKGHRRWTAFRNLFTGPLQGYYRAGKSAVINWQVAEQRKREEEQRRLQAEADERARKERERLEKQAEAARARGDTEKAEAKAEAAAAVVTPEISLPEARVSGVTVREVWSVKSDPDGDVLVDHRTFFAAAATDENLWDFVEFKRGKLVSAKTANPRREIPGITFEKVNR